MTEPGETTATLALAAGPVVTPDERRAIERWFVAHGMPNFIRDYTAARNVWTRALPALIAWYAIGVFAGVRDEGTPEEDVAVIGLAIAILLGGWLVLNRYRGTPLFSRPDRIGWLEIAGFLVLPAAIPFVIQEDPGQALVVVVGNALFLGLAYAVTQLGLIGITRWALARVVARAHEVSQLFGRALALLVVLIGFAFFDEALWKVADRADGFTLLTILLMFAGVALLFISTLLPSELRRLQSTLPTDETLEMAERSPAAPLTRDPRVAESIDRREEPHPLARREIVNLSVVILANEAIGGLLVGAIVAGALVVLGLVAVPQDVAESWTGHAVAPLVAGYGSVSWESVKVALILGGFSGLAFALSALSDVVYRKDFEEVSLGSARRAVAVREVYLTGLEIDDELAGAEEPPGVEGPPDPGRIASPTGSPRSGP